MLKFSRKLLFVLVLVMSFSVFASAESLKIEKTIPKANEKEVPIENFSFKLHFNKPVRVKDSERKKLAKYIKIVDPKGKKIKTRILFDKREKSNEMLVLALPKSGAMKPDTKYKLKIDKDFKSVDGSTLDKDVSITIKTLDQSRNSKINFLIIGLMVVFMIIFSSKKFNKIKSQTEEIKPPKKVNPYKEAKRTGKSVEEIIEKQKKEQEKYEKKLEKQREKVKQAKEEARKAAEEKAKKAEADRIPVKKVKKPRVADIKYDR